MTRKNRVVALLLMFCLMSGLAAPTLAHAQSQVVLPEAQELSAEQMQQVEGEGLIGAAWGVLGGAVTGAVHYTASYAWDRYIDHDNRAWSWSDFGKETGSTALAGGVWGALHGP